MIYMGLNQLNELSNFLGELCTSKSSVKWFKPITDIEFWLRPGSRPFTVIFGSDMIIKLLKIWLWSSINIQSNSKKEIERVTYPIMARKHEMISSSAVIPERIFIRDDVNVVGNKSLEANPGVAGVACVRTVDEANDVYDADGDEEEHGIVGTASGERTILTFQFIHELSLDSIDEIHGAWVK